MSLVKGLLVTFRTMLRPPVTVLYPYQRLELAKRYRGFMGLAPAPTEQAPVEQAPKDETEAGAPETGKGEGSGLKCIACLLCMNSCPVKCISIEREKEGKKFVLKSYSIDFSRCTFCGGCVSACPVKGKAIVHTQHYEESFLRREDAVFDIRELACLGRGLRPHEPLSAEQIETLRAVRQESSKFGLEPAEKEALDRFIANGYFHRVRPEELGLMQKLVSEGSRLGVRQRELLRRAIDASPFELSTYAREEAGE
jgi:NADH-quinone oxidoreductase subunit I